jgi:hypothetical protein
VTAWMPKQGARLLVTSIAGALVVLGGLIFTGVNYRLSRRGQITDRFSKALERLSSAQLYGRVGGIHALERVMHDSPGHLDDVIEVLAAFIREHAPRSADRAARSQAARLADAAAAPRCRRMRAASPASP